MITGGLGREGPPPVNYADAASLLSTHGLMQTGQPEQLLI